MARSRYIPQFLSAAALATALSLGGCASTQPSGQITRLSPQDLARLVPPANPKVPLSDVIAWSQEGASSDAIIKRLQDTGTFYNLTAQQIVDLNQRGVNQRVIDHLAEAQEKARQATLLTQLADRDAQAAQALEAERNRRRALQQQYQIYGYGGVWRPRFGAGFGASPGYSYDPFFRTWRPRW